MIAPSNAIAIIGLGCCFPGANNIDEYWSLLKSGKSAISYFSQDELTSAGVSDIVLNNPDYVRARGILSDGKVLEPSKYNFSSAEITNLNPQSKIFLYLVEQALEDARIHPESCPSKTAVFTGSNDSEMLEIMLNNHSKKMSLPDLNKYFYTKALSSLVAYQFNLHGKVMNVHTGCSTSLVAIVQACEELLAKNADLAIAGAASIIYPQKMGYFSEDGGVLSADGICRPFDASANGTVLSNGAGVVVLKRLEDAVKSGDRIYSIIVGKAVTNDGRMKFGFLAPSIHKQYECIKCAWDNAKIALKQVSYIEAHGSATLVGDPIEIFALKKMCNQQKYHHKWCGLGSVKANIGHTTVASGMAAIIKASLMLYHRKIIPTINFKQLNKNINLEDTPFYIATEYQPLPDIEEKPYIGISNFGLGGTNVHIILTLDNMT